MYRRPFFQLQMKSFYQKAVIFRHRQMFTMGDASRDLFTSMLLELFCMIKNNCKYENNYQFKSCEVKHDMAHCATCYIERMAAGSREVLFNILSENISDSLSVPHSQGWSYHFVILSVLLCLFYFVCFCCLCWCNGVIRDFNITAVLSYLCYNVCYIP